jgi:hypothetical protein
MTGSARRRSSSPCCGRQHIEARAQCFDTHAHCSRRVYTVALALRRKKRACEELEPDVESRVRSPGRDARGGGGLCSRRGGGARCLAALTRLAAKRRSSPLAPRSLRCPRIPLAGRPRRGPRRARRGPGRARRGPEPPPWAPRAAPQQRQVRAPIRWPSRWRRCDGSRTRTLPLPARRPGRRTPSASHPIAIDPALASARRSWAPWGSSA